MTTQTTTPPRVALLVPSLNTGGGARVALNVASGLARLGYSVDLLALSPGGELESECPSNVRIVHPAPLRALAAGSRLASWLSGARYVGSIYASLPRLTKYLKAERPVALAAFGGNSVAVTAVKLSGGNCRAVATAHAVLGPGLNRQSPLRRAVQLSAMRWYAANADAVVAVSQGVAADVCTFTGVPRERITVIQNPVVVPGFYDRANEPVNHPWFADSETPVILAAGRLIPQKDFPTLIHAFARLTAKRQARLLILGEGPERKKLGALVQELGLGEAVSLPGHQRNPLKFIKRASVFALSSVSEGFGLVLAEALALGTPVVSTDCASGPTEILDHGKFGRLVPMRDPDALADAILATLESPPDAEPLRARGREFSLDAILPRYIDALGLPPVSPA